MKRIFYFFIILIFLSTKPIIFENASIECLNDYVSNDDTLLIVDIDNTLIKPISNLGSDEWFYAFVNEMTSKGLDYKKSISKILPLYIWIQNLIKVEPVEKTTVDLIQKIQKKNIKVIALTIRSFELETITVKQLRSIDIDLSDKWFYNKFFVNIHNEDQGLFSSGIVFCNGNDKGEVLKAFLEKIKYRPKKIVFIDDKLKYLKSVEKILEKTKIEFIGIRYSYLDELVKTYKLQSFDIEFLKSLIH